MERRFLLFLLLSFLVLAANAVFNARNAPKRVAQDGAQQQDVEGAADGDPQAEGEGDQDNQDDDQSTEPAENGESDEADQPPADELEEEADAPLQFVTLGSIDEASDFRMAATIVTSGAGVRRIELASPRYLDLDDKGGYLGHLELAADISGGLLVRAVCNGTPAAIAGVRQGDRILQAGVDELVDITDVDALRALLNSRKPGDQLQLTLVRNGSTLPTTTVELARVPLSIVRPESDNLRRRTDVLPKGLVEASSFRMTMGHVDAKGIAAEEEEVAGVDLLSANWRIVQQDETSVTLERRLPAHGLVVSKRYELARISDAEQADGEGADGEDANGAAAQPSRPNAAYHLTLSVSIKNEGQQPSSLSYLLYGPNGLPVEGWWYANKIGRNWGGAGLRDVTGRYFGGDPEQQSPAKIVEGDVEDFEGGSMAYMAIDAQYFGVALLPNKTNADDVWIESARSVLIGPKPAKRSGGARFANVSCLLKSAAQSLKPGESLEHSYTVFAGPKSPDLLAKYKAADSPRYTLADLVYYGWFGAIARAMLGILHFFYGVVGNYGVSIILLTALVRGCMFPISRTQAHSMVRMQELRPEMDRLKEKHKGDQQKQAQAMQELYRKHKVNPLAGCLPMLIQLPVFVGLYRGLAVDVELRQASLFGESVRWCSNLAAPDMFLDWSGFMPEFVNRGDSLFSLGPYLNVLPLVTITLWIVQQKLFMPPPANEQAEMQQKIMKYMMLFMGLLFYKVPSGLCLYFISSTLWGIAERKLVPPPTAKPDAAPGKPGDASSGSERSSSSRKSSDTRRAAKNGRAGGKQRSKSKRRR